MDKFLTNLAKSAALGSGDSQPSERRKSVYPEPAPAAVDRGKGHKVTQEITGAVEKRDPAKHKEIQREM